MKTPSVKYSRLHQLLHLIHPQIDTQIPSLQTRFCDACSCISSVQTEKCNFPTTTSLTDLLYVVTGFFSCITSNYHARNRKRNVFNVHASLRIKLDQLLNFKDCLRHWSPFRTFLTSAHSLSLESCIASDALKAEGFQLPDQTHREASQSVQP